MRFQPSSASKVAIFVIVVALLGGCATSGELSDSKKNQLIQRVKDRWACLQVNDYVCAYEFLTPAYRQAFSPEMYLGRFSNQLLRVLTGATVDTYDARAAVASVTTRVMSRPVKYTNAASRAIGATPSTSTESWIRKNGEWWIIESTR